MPSAFDPGTTVTWRGGLGKWPSLGALTKASAGETGRRLPLVPTRFTEVCAYTPPSPPSWTRLRR
eukprot:2746798-Pyramimonas_sp.AAC.1